MRTGKLELICLFECMPGRMRALGAHSLFSVGSRPGSFSRSLPSRFCILFYTQVINTTAYVGSQTQHLKGGLKGNQTPPGPWARPRPPGPRQPRPMGSEALAIQTYYIRRTLVFHVTPTIKKYSQPKHLT